MRSIYHPLDWIMLAAAIVFFVVCAARYSGGMAATIEAKPNATITTNDCSP